VARVALFTFSLRQFLFAIVLSQEPFDLRERDGDVADVEE
jgi:hypothetical protein